MDINLQLSAIQREKLSEPPDYYLGRERTPITDPRNIVVFHRSSATALKGKEPWGFQHRRYVFVYCISGPGNLLINNRSIAMAPGKACLIYPYELHFYSELEGEKLSWLFVTFEAETGGLLGSIKTRSWNLNQHAKLMLGQLVQRWLDEEAGLTHYLSITLLELNHRCAESNSSPRSTAPTSTFLRINDTLSSNPNHSWTLAELAEQVGISQGHLCRQFRRETQSSLGRYIRKYRITRAAQLLETTTDRIQEISEQCGFDSPYAFSRTFKKEMGCSPRAYRERANLEK